MDIMTAKFFESKESKKEKGPTEVEAGRETKKKRKNPIDDPNKASLFGDKIDPDDPGDIFIDG